MLAKSAEMLRSLGCERSLGDSEAIAGRGGNRGTLCLSRPPVLGLRRWGERAPGDGPAARGVRGGPATGDDAAALDELRHTGLRLSDAHATLVHCSMDADLARQLGCEQQRHELEFEESLACSEQEAGEKIWQLQNWMEEALSGFGRHDMIQLRSFMRPPPLIFVLIRPLALLTSYLRIGGAQLAAPLHRTLLDRSSELSSTIESQLWTYTRHSMADPFRFTQQLEAFGKQQCGQDDNGVPELMQLQLRPLVRTEEFVAAAGSGETMGEMCKVSMFACRLCRWLGWLVELDGAMRNLRRNHSSLQQRQQRLLELRDQWSRANT